MLSLTKDDVLMWAADSDELRRGFPEEGIPPVMSPFYYSRIVVTPEVGVRIVRETEVDFEGQWSRISPANIGTPLTEWTFNLSPLSRGTPPEGGP